MRQMRTNARKRAKIADAPGVVKRMKALGMLLSGMPSGEVARELGVTASTVSRWRAEPDFAQLLATAKADTIEQAKAKIRDEALRAINALVEMAHNPKTSEAVRATLLRDLADRASLKGIERSELTVHGDADLSKLTPDQLREWKRLQALTRSE